MVRNQFLTLAAGAMLAFAAGCGTSGGAGDSGNDTGVTPDAGGMDGGSNTDAGNQPETGSPDTGTGQGMTLTYVLDQLQIDDNSSGDPTSPDTKYHGFNVDGLFSSDVDDDGCNKLDLYPISDNDQLNPPNCDTSDTTGCRPGVDNQLPDIADAIATAVGTDVRATLSDQINSNSLVLLIRVTDVNSLQNDTSVGLDLYTGYPKFTTGCTGVMPNRHYDVSQAALTSGGTTLDNALFHFTGAIVNGRLVVNMGMGSTFNLPLPPIMGQTINLAVHSTQLRMNLSAAEASDGNLGGWVLGQQLVDAVVALSPSNASIVQQVLGNYIDVRINPDTGMLDPTNGICYQRGNDAGPSKFGGLSLGLGLHAVPAVIDGVAAAQTAGTCGASTSDGGTADGG